MSDWMSRSVVVPGGPQPAATPDYLRRSLPADTTPDPQTIAYAADDADPVRATETLDVAGQTGLDPNYVSQDLDAAKKARDQARLAAQLDGKPALSAWAAQSPHHAAAVRHDAGALGNIEGWLSGMGDALRTGVLDIEHAEAMREYMGSGGPFAKYALGSEEALREYDRQSHSYGQQIARAIPQMALYAGAGALTGGVGVAGLLYVQNKGVLARQIQLAQPGPSATGEDTSLSPEDVDKYATAGSAAAAITLAGLLGPMLRSMPGAREGLQRATSGVLARAAATTVGAAAIRALGAYGVHTLMGATGMALQSSINSFTVKKAANEDVDWQQMGRELGDNFMKVLPIAATFSAYGPFKDFLEDRGRITAAVRDGVSADAMVEQARAAEMVKRSPNLASDLFGMMGRGAKMYVDYKAASRIPEIPAEDVAAATAAQGDVSVPAGDYLARMNGSHDAVRDDVKQTADGYTPAEAQARVKELRETLSPKDARALYGKLAPDELQKLEMPIAADMPEGLRKQFEDLRKPKSETPDVATKNERVTPEPTAAFPKPPEREPTSSFAVPHDTAVTRSLHEAMAKEYGGTPEKWAEILTPELMEALNEEKSVGAISPEEHAARLIEAMPVGDIDPLPFKRLAARANKSIQKMAEQAVTGGPAEAKRTSLRDVAALSAHELARDVNLAKEKKAAAVKEEMQKAAAKITSQAVNDKLRASLQKAGGPLLRLFDALTEGSSLSPLRQGWVAAHQEAVGRGMPMFSDVARQFADDRIASSLDEAHQWFDLAARPFEFDEAGLRRFLEKPRPWGELTPAEARNIKSAIDQLTKAAREETIVRAGDAQATVDEAAGEIRGELQKNPDKGLPKQTGMAPDSWVQRRLQDANAANAIQLRPKNNLRQKSTAAVKWIFNRIQEAVYARDDFFREAGEKYREAFDAMPKDISARRYETYDLSDKLPVQGTQPMNAVPRQWVWKLARHWGSQGNIDRVVSTSGWDRDVLSGILFDDPKTKLSIPEWDYIQSLSDINEQYVWPKLKAHFEKFYGLAPPKTAGVPFRVRMEDGTWKDYAGGYEPLKRDARPGVAPMAEPTKGIAQYWGRDFQIPWTPGSAKERVDNSHYLVNMDWDTGRATLAQTLHWLAFDQPVRDVAKLLNDQGLAADMNRSMGQGRADMTRAWLKSSATRQAGAVPEGMEQVAAAFGWQRRLALMQIVGGSARLAAAQLTHPVGLMLGGEVHPLHGMAALISTFKPMTMADGEVRLFPNWNDALGEYKEVQHRAENAYGSLREQWDRVGPDGRKGPLGALKELAQKTAGLYLHAVDRLTTSWAAVAFENEGISRYKFEPGSQELKDYVNSKVQDVMPAHDVETAAPILTNRQMGGFLVMHGFKNTLYNMRQDALAKSVLDFHQAQTAGQYGAAAARTAGRIGLQVAMFGGFAVMGKLILGYGQQSDEHKGDWLSRTFLAGQTEDIPLIGGLGEPIAKWMLGGKVSRRDFETYSNPGVAAINKVYELLGSLVNDGREDYKKVFDALETTLFFSGVPSRPVRIGAEHLYEKLTGEGYDDVSGDQGRYFYTEKQWDSIRRSLTPDED